MAHHATDGWLQQAQAVVPEGALPRQPIPATTCFTQPPLRVADWCQYATQLPTAQGYFLPTPPAVWQPYPGALPYGYAPPLNVQPLASFAPVVQGPSPQLRQFKDLPPGWNRVAIHGGAGAWRLRYKCISPSGMSVDTPADAWISHNGEVPLSGNKAHRYKRCRPPPPGSCELGLSKRTQVGGQQPPAKVPVSSRGVGMFAGAKGRRRRARPPSWPSSIVASMKSMLCRLRAARSSSPPLPIRSVESSACSGTYNDR